MSAVGAVAAGVAALKLFLPEILAAYLQRLWYSAVYLTEAPNLVLSRRLDNWRLILEYIQEHPWQSILGVGYKTLPYTDLVGKPIVADNTYLSLLLETGVAGLGALLLVLAAVLRACYRAARVPSNSRHSRCLRLVGLWMFSSWCGLATQMWSADVLTYWRVLPLLFVPVAMVVRDTSDADTLP
jgi:O-antigen ligase